MLSDRDILDAIKKGDPMQVMGKLYKKEYPKLERYVLQNSGNKDDAKDMFQEAVMTFFTHVKFNKFNEKYDIGAFLYVVGCNRWKKKNKQKLALSSIDEVHTVSIHENLTYERIFTKETQQLVNDLFESIGDNCNKILHLSIFHDRSLKELADELGYDSIDTVKTRRYKCKQKLISLLQKNPALSNLLKESLRAHEA